MGNDSTMNLACESTEEYLGRLPNSSRSRINVGDWDINVVTAGSGPTVLLLHGLGTSWRWWEPTIDRLISTNTIVAIDLPSAGDSSDLSDTPTAAQYVNLVRVILEEFGPACVVGHSFGGFAALQAAIAEVSGLEGAFLYAPAGFGKVENKYFRALSVRGIGTALSHSGPMGVELLLKSLVHDPKHVAQMDCWIDDSPEAKSRFLFQIEIGIDWLGRTHKELQVSLTAPIKTPIRLVWGKYDSIFSLETGYHAANILGLPGPRIAESSGHFIHVEQPDWFVDELTDFLQLVNSAD